MLKRPSNHETCKKIKDALEALRAGKFMIGFTKHLSADMDELNLESEAELVPLLCVLLGEIDEVGPIECYAGTRPPQRSYEQEILSLELWAYSWPSKRFGKGMYLKFAFKKDHFVYVDCHPDNPRLD